ncbi:DUF1775 domain-containing protein [Paenibacillus protaetiae]|uniref:DUF1775 domain-containing protein n=2 Tax=Paenibacillus protaetiae TaxID=2509456 RepID=A0A4P6FCJ2_9BACL|nr:DUF1775 domain-containing protein [Paenibacillus protaetiae]
MLAVAGLLLFANMASAHVTVSPQKAEQGAYQVFTVRVPSETKDKHTVSVSVDIPEGVIVSRTTPIPGWSYIFTKDADGKVTNVKWTADNEGLSQTEFQDFQLSGRVQDDAADLVWKAHQTYNDGEVIDWADTAADAQFPASITTVSAAGSLTDEGGGAKQDWALGLSIAAVVLGAAALAAAVAGSRRKTSN